MVKIVESSFNCNLLYGFMRLKSIQPEGYTSVSCATIAPIKCTVFLFSHSSTYLANKKETSSKTIKLRDIFFSNWNHTVACAGQQNPIVYFELYLLFSIIFFVPVFFSKTIFFFQNSNFFQKPSFFLPQKPQIFFINSGFFFTKTQVFFYQNSGFFYQNSGFFFTKTQVFFLPKLKVFSLKT